MQLWVFLSRIKVSGDDYYQVVIKHKLTWLTLRKEAKWKCQFLQKSAKSPVSYINWVHFFILFSHGFTWKLTVKKGKFCGKFLEKVRFFGKVSWICDIGLKCWNCQIRAEKNWNCQHALTKNLTFFKNLPQNLPFFTVSFQVKPYGKKMNPVYVWNWTFSRFLQKLALSIEIAGL